MRAAELVSDRSTNAPTDDGVVSRFSDLDCCRPHWGHHRPTDDTVLRRRAVRRGRRDSDIHALVLDHGCRSDCERVRRRVALVSSEMLMIHSVADDALKDNCAHLSE